MIQYAVGSLTGRLHPPCVLQELYTGVKDPTEVIEKYAAMWSYQPLFDGRRTR